MICLGYTVKRSSNYILNIATIKMKFSNVAQLYPQSLISWGYMMKWVAILGGLQSSSYALVQNTLWLGYTVKRSSNYILNIATTKMKFSNVAQLYPQFLISWGYMMKWVAILGGLQSSSYALVQNTLWLGYTVKRSSNYILNIATTKMKFSNVAQLYPQFLIYWGYMMKWVAILGSLQSSSYALVQRTLWLYIAGPLFLLLTIDQRALCRGFKQTKKLIGLRNAPEAPDK